MDWFENNRGDPIDIFLELEFDEFVSELFEFLFLAKKLYIIENSYLRMK